MIGFVVATHGNFASGIMSAVDLIMGKQEKVVTLGLNHGDDINAFGDKIVDAVNSVDSGDGVIIFADLFAASPYNQSALAHERLKNVKYKLITGVNLPMLVEAFGARLVDKNLEETKKAALESGQTGIKEFFDELAKNRE